jgi:hypothetical protein
VAVALGRTTGVVDGCAVGATAAGLTPGTAAAPGEAAAAPDATDAAAAAGTSPGIAAATPRSSSVWLPDRVTALPVTSALAGWTTPGTAAVPDAALAGAARWLGAALAVGAAWCVGATLRVAALGVGRATPGTTASPPDGAGDTDGAAESAAPAFPSAADGVAVGQSPVSFDGAAGAGDGAEAEDGWVVPSSEPVARCPLSTKPTTPSAASEPR